MKFNISENTFIPPHKNNTIIKQDLEFSVSKAVQNFANNVSQNEIAFKEVNDFDLKSIATNILDNFVKEVADAIKEPNVLLRKARKLFGFKFSLLERLNLRQLNKIVRRKSEQIKNSEIFKAIYCLKPKLISIENNLFFKLLVSYSFNLKQNQNQVLHHFVIERGFPPFISRAHSS